ncbi:MAG TPA: hypothetical protein VKK79_24095 [Candidatus Lokiarchaeia archaeon]|nr:hypothetical protein [Candidatus Lokiarchaeia archaeon]
MASSLANEPLRQILRWKGALSVTNMECAGGHVNMVEKYTHHDLAPIANIMTMINAKLKQKK